MNTDKGDLSANTYPGRRTDLVESEDYNAPSKNQIKRIALLAAFERRGTTAYEVSNYTGCSKEWARKLLLELESEGLMKVRQFSQLKLYQLTDEGIAKLKEGEKDVQ